MENKKIERLNDQELENVNGGKDEKKYCVGDVVKFKKIIVNLMFFGPISMTLTGTITAINDGVYAIEAGGDTYYVRENLIKGLA